MACSGNNAAMEKECITVYCASSAHIAQAYFDTARALGAEIARRGMAVVNGGGASGLMGAVSDGALEAGGEAVGVIPGFMVEAGLCHQGLTRAIVVPDMHTRKRTMAQMSVGAIALPGGVGTMEELLEMLTWRKLGLYPGRVVILNTAGYYDPLLHMLRRSAEQGFSTEASAADWLVASTATQAVDMILGTHTEK